MLRVLLLVVDAALADAVAAALDGDQSVRSVDPHDRASTEAALRGTDWAVCVADATTAADALAARRGRGSWSSGSLTPGSWRCRTAPPARP
jgi:hypothetical protein